MTLCLLHFCSSLRIHKSQQYPGINLCVQVSKQASWVLSPFITKINTQEPTASRYYNYYRWASRCPGFSGWWRFCCPGFKYRFPLWFSVSLDGLLVTEHTMTPPTPWESGVTIIYLPVFRKKPQLLFLGITWEKSVSLPSLPGTTSCPCCTLFVSDSGKLPCK